MNKVGLSRIGAVMVAVWVLGVAGTAGAWDCGKIATIQGPSSVKCTLDDDGTFTIRGFGYMENFASSTNRGWHRVRDSIKTVVIEQGVGSIADYAFRDCKNLTAVIIYDGELGLDSIGRGAFMSCVSLGEITIPRFVTFIGSGAFAGCAGMTKMTMLNPIPPTVKYDIVEELDNIESLYVPEASVDQYNDAENWKKFPDIKPIAQTSVCPATQPSPRTSPPAIAVFRNNRLHLTLPAGAYTASLININGRVVSRARITATDGVNTVNLQPPRLSKGAYLLDVRRRDGTAVVAERVLVR